MGEHSKIEWTDHTFNPWVGCAKVSPACRSCYAEGWAKRTGQAALWRGERRRTSAANWRKPHRWNEAAAATGERPRVFCASLADVFEDHPELEPWRAELWDLIRATPCLDWLLLTKRPENIARMLPSDWGTEGWANVWLGTTVEDQVHANERIPHLLRVPAAVRFLSCEPLLGDLDLEPWLSPERTCERCDTPCGSCPLHQAVVVDGDFDEATGDHPPRTLQWVIAGGESGANARPSHQGWFRSLRNQCERAGVPFFFKQWGEWAPGNGGAGGDLFEGVDRARIRSGFFDYCGRFYDVGPNPFRQTMDRVGKAAAGRLLDGAEHSALPGVRRG